MDLIGAGGFALLYPREAGFCPVIYCRGEQPIIFLKALVKVLADSSPRDCAISEMESLVFTILSPASSIRQRVRYSIGDTPTIWRNLSAKVDRDMPPRRANSSTVQSCAGSLCIDAIAALIGLSDRAKRTDPALSRRLRSRSSSQALTTPCHPFPRTSPSPPCPIFFRMWTMRGSSAKRISPCLPVRTRCPPTRRQRPPPLYDSMRPFSGTEKMVKAPTASKVALVTGAAGAMLAQAVTSELHVRQNRGRVDIC